MAIDDFYSKLNHQTEEINDTLSASHTHLNRFYILIEKIAMQLNGDELEELGEFMVDWGNNIIRFGNLSKERADLILEILDFIEGGCDG